MDLETENRLAALLMEEARGLRSHADKEGVHVYLQQPNVRGRPNSRFLTATVLGVQQANRAVEVGEMWRAREKELELEAKSRSRAKDKQTCNSLQVSSRHREVGRNSVMYCSSSKRAHEDYYTVTDGALRDEEVEKFLHSRAKRGRGAIGSRMDEPGPYISSTSSGQQLMASPETRTKEEWECRILGPEKPSFLKSHESLKDGHGTKVRLIEGSERKHRSKERRSKKCSKAKREEKSSNKHRHKSRRRD